MFQTDQATAATSLPAPASPGTPGYFTNGNPGTGVAATILDADFMNMTMLELCNIVTAAGMTLSKTTYNQVLLAIKRLVQNQAVLTDTGAANAYAAANTPPLVTATWTSGVTQQIVVGHTNTGASTYAPDGLPTTPIYGLGLQPLQGGEMFAGGTAIMMKQTIAGVNSGNPIVILLECAGGAQQIPAATQPLHALQLGQVTNTASPLALATATPTQPTSAAQFQQIGNFQGSISVTGATTLTNSIFGNYVSTPSGNAGGYTITLPSVTGNGSKSFSFLNAANTAVTLSAANFNSAYGSATSTISIPPSGSAVFECDGASYNAIGGSASVGTPPRPTASTGPGNFIQIATSSAYALPAGGTWAYAIQIFAATAATSQGSFAGIAAGGSTIFTPSSNDAQGWAWRIM